MLRKPYLFCFLLAFLNSAFGANSNETYVSSLRTAIYNLSSNLNDITLSAQEAAADFVAGGNIWAAGPQDDFVSEACSRAGGLMAIRPLNPEAVRAHDVILFAVPGYIKTEDFAFLHQVQKNSARAIKFNSKAGTFGEHFPIDTVINIVRLWTWTGEFVAACTRLGKMPVLYQSYGVPGGKERGAKYQGQKFHHDVTIKPVPPGVLGDEYVTKIIFMLEQIQNETAKMTEAANWWAHATNPTTTFVVGHMFPWHLEDPRTISSTRFIAAPAWEDKDLLQMTGHSSFIFYLGYQSAPEKLVGQAMNLRVKLAYVAVQPARPIQSSKTVLWINPVWPLADGCVSLSGYDIPILPASGIVQAAIYWTIASERETLANSK